jgi:hypothetical protein
MSIILATNNLNTQTWEIVKDITSSNFVDLHIGFTNDLSLVSFDNLQFSYELKYNNVVEKFEKFPKTGIKYISSDQKFLVIDRIDVDIEKEYQLSLFVENSGKKSNISFQFMIPKPPSPYPSWIWEESVWNSPIPYPDDGQMYVWNEELQQWEVVNN